MSEFAARLKELRNEKGLTLKEVAQKTGLSITAISQWENENRIPNLNAVIMLANFFEVSIDYLAGRIDY
ncbi:MAG: helix-turn-helix domain-containing protein [Firmicutes bacterium]|nr:helix-turn-helix domain-containing protein [Bacillota bacterium]